MTDQVGKIEQTDDHLALKIMEQNTRIRQLEAQLAECERRVFARIREKGFVVVPREPTVKMFDDGHEALVETHKVGQYGECPGLGWDNSGACYRAMLSTIDQDEIEREVCDGAN